jgi:hypothetical protein
MLVKQVSFVNEALGVSFLTKLRAFRIIGIFSNTNAGTHVLYESISLRTDMSEHLPCFCFRAHGWCIKGLHYVDKQVKNVKPY